MKKFEKGKHHIVIFLLAFVVISAIVFLTTFSNLTIKGLSLEMETRIYVFFSVVAATMVYFWTKKKFELASQYEKTSEIRNSNDLEEQRRAEQEKLAKEAKRKKAEEEKKQAELKVSEAIANLDGISESDKYFDQLLINLSKIYKMVQGVAYIWNENSQNFSIIGTYAYYTQQTDRTFELGEGITGQVAKDQQFLQLDNVPDNYIKVVSGLGSTSSLSHLLVVPFVTGNKTVAVLELAAFEKSELNNNIFFEELNAKVAEKISTMLK